MAISFSGTCAATQRHHTLTTATANTTPATLNDHISTTCTCTCTCSNTCSNTCVSNVRLYWW